MATLLEDLYAFLAESSEVVELLGSESSRTDGRTGIFPVLMPEGTPPPAVVLETIAAEEIVTLDGASGFRESRIQITCYGATYSDARRLADAIWRLLQGLHTTLPGGTEVDAAICRGIEDAFEMAPLLYVTPLDVDFYFREPINS